MIPKNSVLIILTTVVMVFVQIQSTKAQDITSLNYYKYITVQPASANVAVPRFEKLSPDIEYGIRQLLKHNKIPVLNNRKDATDKGINNCEILTCVYSINYQTGMMYNAIITYSLHFNDCNNKEVLVLTGKKSVGVAIGSEGYVKLFTALMKPYSSYIYAYKAAAN
jgi:hypothetical protein